MKAGLSKFVVAILLFGLTPRIAADDRPDPEFDLLRTNGQLVVLLDLAPFISAHEVELLKDGLDHTIRYQLDLVRPRRIWGAETKAVRKGRIKISYRLLTSDFQLVDSRADTVSERTFRSLAKLHRFLADSIHIPVATLDSLDEDHYYVMEIKIICLTPGIALLTGDRPDKSTSPVGYLFGKFLDISGYGRSEQETKSRPFRISEIE